MKNKNIYVGNHSPTVSQSTRSQTNPDYVSGNKYTQKTIDEFVKLGSALGEKYVTSVYLRDTNIWYEVKRIMEEEDMVFDSRIDAARLFYLVIWFQGVYTHSREFESDDDKECKIVQLVPPKDDGRSSSLLENLSSMFLWFN